MDVRLWMSRDPIVATPDMPVAEAVRLMSTHRIRHLPVLERGSGRLAGLVTTHDIALAAGAGIQPGSPRALESAGRCLVADIMVPVAFTVRSDASIEEAARLLRDTKLGVLPVVNDGKLVGILTDNDVLRAFLEVAGAEDASCEVTLELASATDAVADLAELGRRHGLQISSVVSFTHDRRRLGVVRFRGAPTEAFLDDVWRTARTVLRIRGGDPAPAPAAASR